MEICDHGSESGNAVQIGCMEICDHGSESGNAVHVLDVWRSSQIVHVLLILFYIQNNITPQFPKMKEPQCSLHERQLFITSAIDYKKCIS